MPTNDALQRTSCYRGRAILEMDCVFGGAKWVPCPAAQLNH